jgi:hypothetical protein
MLNSKYFQTIHDDTDDTWDYHVVRPLGNPMVLFSKEDGSPLAALHLECQNNHVQNDAKGNRGKALFTKRPDKSTFNCDFQGLVDRDGQEIELVITNLCTEGMIDFNIMRDSKIVDTVDPGGLNQVNELRPGDSYVVQCDQADNKILVLKAIVNSGGQHVTVAKDETDKHGPSGSYFYLSVVPQLGFPQTIEKFKETEWACVDMFVRKTKKYVPMNFICGLENQKKDQRMDGCFQSIMFDPHASSSSMASCKDDGRIVSYEVEIDEQVDDASRCFVKQPETQTQTQTKVTIVKTASNKKSATSQSDDTIKDSLASRVTSGDRTIDTIGYYSGVNYSFNTASVPCCISLSVSNKIVFGDEPNFEHFVALAKEMIQDYMTAGAKAFLEKLTTIFKSDVCGICLDGVDSDTPNQLDCVFYQCGHQCCHYECGKTLNKCPMCRTHITAKIRV